MPNPALQLPAQEALQVDCLRPGLVCTRMVGRVTRADADRGLLLFRARVGQAQRQNQDGTSGLTWLIDATRLSSFASDAVLAGSAWFSAFREADGKRLVFVSELPAARMVAATLAFASKLSVARFDTLPEAMRYLR